MTRWIVYKHRFLYTGKQRRKDAAEPCTLEIIVSVNGSPISEKTVKNTLLKIMSKIFVEVKDSTGGRYVNMPMYDFGSLTWNEILDDIRKLFIVDYPKRTGTKVQLWLDKSDDISLWDDGIDDKI